MMRYYFAWKCGEGAYNASGMGYESEDKDGNAGNSQGCQNMDIIGMETSQSVQQLSRAWNQKTQHWLEAYTYKRVSGSRLKQQIVTYAVSAFWHGLEIGFYFFFLSIPFLDMAREEMRAKVRPYFVNVDDKGKETPKSTKKLYDFMSWA